MAQWSKNYTEIDNVNSGNEFTINDYPTPQAFNVALNNSSNNHKKVTDIENGDTRVPKATDSTNAKNVETTRTEVGNIFSYNLVFCSQAISNVTNSALKRSDNIKCTPSGDLSLAGNVYFYSEYSQQNENLDNVIQRLDELGFKSGVITSSDITISNYTLTKQGKMALLDMELSGQLNANQTYTFNIPQEFIPTTQQVIFFGSYRSTQIGLQTFWYWQGDYGTVNTNGTITITPETTITSTVRVRHAGWKLN